MSDIESIMSALQKADEAGNTDDAKKLAQMALDYQASQQTTKGNRGFSAFLNQGITQALGAPVDIITAGLNVIPGVDIKKPIGGSENLRDISKWLGDVHPDEGAKPENFGEEFGSVLGTNITMALPMLGLLSKTSKGVGLASNISKKLLETFAKNPILSAASEVTAAAGSAGGRRTAENLAPENQGLKTALDVGGAVIGGLAPNLANFSMTFQAIKMGIPVVKKMGSGFTPGGIKYRANQALSKAVDNSETALENMSKETIADLPPAVRSGNAKLTSMYKTLANMDPTKETETAARLTKEMINLEKEMRKLGYGAPELISEITKARSTAIELKMAGKVANAVENAEKKLSAIPASQRQSKESVIVRNELDKAMTAENQTVKDAWKKVDKSITVDTEDIRSNFKNIYDDLSIAEKDMDVPSFLKKNPVILGRTVIDENGVKDVIFPEEQIKEIEGLRSKLLETAKIASKEGHYNKARVSNEIASMLLDAMESSPVADDILPALQATRNYHNMFHEGVVGDLLGTTKTGAPRVDPTLILDKSIGKGGIAGAVDIEKLAITPESKTAMESYLARNYTDYASKSGEINPTKSKLWIEKNADTLDKFPELKAKIEDATGAQELAAQVKTKHDAYLKKLKDPKQSVTAMIINSPDIGATVKNVLKSPKKLQLVDDLINKAKKDPSGQALGGLESAFLDDLISSSKVGAYNDVGEKMFSGKKLLGELNKNKELYNKLYTPEKINRMRKIANQLVLIENYYKANGKLPDVGVNDSISTMLKVASSMAGAKFGSWIAKRLGGGGSIIIPTLGSEQFQTITRRFTGDKATQLMHDAILSDETDLFKMLLTPMEKPVYNNKKSAKQFLKTFGAWIGGSGSRIVNDMEDIDIEPEEDSQPEPKYYKNNNDVIDLYNSGKMNPDQLEAFNELARRGLIDRRNKGSVTNEPNQTRI